MRGCRPLIDDEIARVMHQFQGRHSRRDRALFVLGLKTGLRCQELLGLRISDLWCGRVLERVKVRRAISKGKKSGVSLPLHPAAAAVLDDYLRHDGRQLPGSAPPFRSANAVLETCPALGSEQRLATPKNLRPKALSGARK